MISTTKYYYETPCRGHIIYSNESHLKSDLRVEESNPQIMEPSKAPRNETSRDTEVIIHDIVLQRLQ